MGLSVVFHHLPGHVDGVRRPGEVGNGSGDVSRKQQDAATCRARQSSFASFGLFDLIGLLTECEFGGVLIGRPRRKDSRM